MEIQDMGGFWDFRESAILYIQNILMMLKYYPFLMAATYQFCLDL